MAQKRDTRLEGVRPAPSPPDTNTETRYRVLFEGQAIGIWRDPECSAARWLVDNGRASRDDILQTYRGEMRCMSGSVDERDGPGKDGTPRFRRWRPNPFAALRGVGLKPASDGAAAPTPPGTAQEAQESLSAREGGEEGGRPAREGAPRAFLGARKPVMPRSRRQSGINPARFRELFEYDPENPLEPRWRKRPQTTPAIATWNARFAGKPVGRHWAGQATRVLVDGKSVHIIEIVEALQPTGDNGLNPEGMPDDNGLNADAGTLASVFADHCRENRLLPGELTVLSEANDPYRCGTPAKRRDAEWFAEHWAESDARHLRGFHYKLIGRATKPNGQPYTGGYKDFFWMMRASTAARWLGLVEFEEFEDRRNSDPVIHRAERDGTELSAGVGASFDAEPPSVDVTEGEAGAISIYPTVRGMTAEQPYILAVFGEKSSLDDELRPVALELGADMYLETGEQSITHAYHIADRAVADGRPLIVLTVSDCDPSGYQMPVSIARKFQALRDLEFPALDVDVIHVGLTPDQVRSFELPSPPLSDTEKRAGRWTELMGVEQTELDSLLALHPGALAQMVRDPLAPYFDSGLAERVDSARGQWRDEAVGLINAALEAARSKDDSGLERIEARAANVSAQIEALEDEAENLRAAALQINDEAEALKAEIQDVNEALAELVSQIDLDPPEAVKAELPDRPTDGPNVVLSSAWSWIEATRRLRARKAYEAGDGEDNDSEEDEE